MGCFSHIDVKIKVCQYRTPCGRDTDDFLLKIHLIDDLADDSMQETMPTPRAVVKRSSLKRFGPGKNLFHEHYPIFFW
jgi:hypothetical protein